MVGAYIKTCSRKDAGVELMHHDEAPSVKNSHGPRGFTPLNHTEIPYVFSGWSKYTKSLDTIGSKIFGKQNHLPIPQ